MSKSVELKVSVVSGALYVGGELFGYVEGLIPEQELTLTLESAAAKETPHAVGVPAAAVTFDEGTKVYLQGNTFIGSGVVEKMDNGDVILRMTETGKRVRVFANEVDQMLTEDANVYVSSKAGLTVGSGVYLDGVTFKGAAKVETFKGGDAILRMPLDEVSGKTNVRIRIKAEDYAAKRVRQPAVAATDFSEGDAVVANGKRFAGEGSVVKSNDGGVSIRLADGGGRRRRGTRLRFDANDLAAGRLTRA